MLIKPINGYEGLYSATSTGDIISHGGKSNHKLDIILKPSLDKDGYRRVTLQHDKKRKYLRICRIVAVTFIPNPEDKPSVNHIDEVKTNDSLENLEWATTYENWKHSNPLKEKTVAQMSMDGTVLAVHKSLMEAGRKTGINQGNITNCLKGRCKSVGGYRWKEINI